MGKLWNFEAFSERPALIGDTGAELTYGDLAALSAELEKAIEPGGERPLVMFVARNTLGGLCGYAALMNLGYPVLPASEGLPTEMWKAIMNLYRPGLLLLPKEKKGACPAMREVFEFRDYVLLRTNFARHYPVNERLGLLITTSGSTGSAKYVRQSWDNLRFNAAAIADFLDIGPSDKSITCLPPQYTYALSMLHANLLRGASVVTTQSGVMDSEFWDLLESEEVTQFHAVPNTYDMLRRIGMFEDDFPDLRLLTQAGGKLSRELQAYYADYAAENGKRFVIMYGQSEATADITWLPPEDALRKPGSVGVVVPGGRASIVDEAGNEITEPHTRGELCYQGPNVAMGYAQRGEDLSTGDEWNGKLRTGDIAEFDEDGYFSITGRLKRYIKLAGHRVSLDEVDGLIMDELNVLSASVGTDDHLTIFVTEEKYRNILLDFIRDRINTARTGLRVMVIDEFPVNEGGKVLYSRLQEIAEKD